MDGIRIMNDSLFPKEISNWIHGQEVPAVSGQWVDKISPCDGTVICHAARSALEDVAKAVKAASAAQPEWENLTPVRRGQILHDFALGLQEHREIVAQVVSLETGKSHKDSLVETDDAISLALFFAGEGQRLYGRTVSSAMPHEWMVTIRQPVGVAGLIVAADTPIYNIVSKVFPALICGNSIVLKAAEDTPLTAWVAGWIANEIELPAGVFNIIQGSGNEAGISLVAHKDVSVISFTGSANEGREIAQVAGSRLARLSLELGGNNPLVVCDDADLEKAARWVLFSSFHNAGQHGTACHRIIIFESIYDKFRSSLLGKTEKLRVGPEDTDDFGPVINEKRLNAILSLIKQARDHGATVLTGGNRLSGPVHKSGFYLAPAFIENVHSGDEIFRTEIFGPVACLYKVKDFAEALELSNDSPRGLAACIHTQNIHRAIEFANKVQADVAMVNAGSSVDPHIPFSGFKQSGIGSREPGMEALDIYSRLKDVYCTANPHGL